MKKSKRKDQQSFKQTEYRDYKRVRILKKPKGNLRTPKRNQLKGIPNLRKVIIQNRATAYIHGYSIYLEGRTQTITGPFDSTNNIKKIPANNLSLLRPIILQQMFNGETWRKFTKTIRHLQGNIALKLEFIYLLEKPSPGYIFHYESLSS